MKKRHQVRKKASERNSGTGWETYQSAAECPLTAFIECQTTGNCQSLATAGTPPEQELQIAFLKIFSEFCELSKETSALGYFVAAGQIAILEAKITSIQAIINALFRNPSHALAAALTSWGYPVTYNPAATQDLFQELIKIEARLKTDDVRLRSLKAELDSQETDGKKAGKQPTTADFDTILINLSGMAGYALRAKELSVQQYALHIAHAKALTKKK